MNQAEKFVIKIKCAKDGDYQYIASFPQPIRCDWRMPKMNTAVTNTSKPHNKKAVASWNSRAKNKIIDNVKKGSVYPLGHTEAAAKRTKIDKLLLAIKQTTKTALKTIE